MEMTRLSLDLDATTTRVRVVESGGEPRGVLEIVSGNMLVTLTMTAAKLADLTGQLARAMDKAIQELRSATRNPS